jgi:hypothetical protein
MRSACWGKNKPLDAFWADLASLRAAVIIFKHPKPYEIIPIQLHSLHSLTLYDKLSTSTAILIAHPDEPDAYEKLVYPKAKDKTVDYVITHYEKFFKRVPAYMQTGFASPLKKLRAPIRLNHK